ncbi:MAG TPA: SRPBCC domain-containing protein [Methylomirabilota bacterium]|nr:SRPBCC domain-containing protein [Methylomirabilota bacterium]
MKSEIKMTGNRLQITRVFDAPRAVVFAYWTRTEKLQQWSGCKDATKVEIEADLRAGGSFTQRMWIAGAGEYTFTGKYEEITEPEKIVYTANMGPATIRITIEFFEEGRRTRVVLTQEGFPDPKMCQIVSQGFSESFEKLDELLAKHSA